MSNPVSEPNLTFVVGHCLSKSDCVEWSNVFSSEKEGLDCFRGVRAAMIRKRSAVLFEQRLPKEAADDESNIQFIPISMSSLHGADVAVILEAARQVTIKHGQKNRGNGDGDSTNTQQEQDDDVSPQLYLAPLLEPTTVNRTYVEQQVADGSAPFVPPSRPLLQQWLLKRSMDLVFARQAVQYFLAGPHRLASLCFFDHQKYPAVKGHIAMTFDDAPCRFGSHNSRVNDIRDLLAKNNNAKATGKFLADTSHDASLVQLLQDGHEFANHGNSDRAHHDLDDEAFLHAVDDCSTRIQRIQQLAGLPTGVRYFRAPHGKYTQRMEELLQTRQLTNVMCDAYASDPIVEDAAYIASSLLAQARDGGILLLHMPERGFREHCWEALPLVLQGLQQRNIKVVTVGMLEALAKGKEITE